MYPVIGGLQSQCPLRALLHYCCLVSQFYPTGDQFTNQSESGWIVSEHDPVNWFKINVPVKVPFHMGGHKRFEERASYEDV